MDGYDSTCFWTDHADEIILLKSENHGLRENIKELEEKSEEESFRLVMMTEKAQSCAQELEEKTRELATEKSNAEELEEARSSLKKENNYFKLQLQVVNDLDKEMRTKLKETKLACQNRIRNLEQQHETETKLMKAQHDRVTKKFKLLTLQLEEECKTADRHQAEAEKANERLKSLKLELENAEDECTCLNIEKRKIQRNLTEQIKETETLKDENTQLRKEIKDGKKKSDIDQTCETELERKTQNLENTDEDVNHQKCRTEEQEKQISSLRHRIHKLETENSLLAQSEAQLQLAAHDHEVQIQDLEKVKGLFAALVNDQEDEIEELRVQLRIAKDCNQISPKECEATGADKKHDFTIQVYQLEEANKKLVKQVKEQRLQIKLLEGQMQITQNYKLRMEVDVNASQNCLGQKLDEKEKYTGNKKPMMRRS